MFTDNIPVCLNCRRGMRAYKNGVLVQSLFQDGSVSAIQSCDMFKCPECGSKSLSGWSKERTDPYMPGFEPMMEAWRKQPTEFQIYLKA